MLRRLLVIAGVVLCASSAQAATFVQQIIGTATATTHTITPGATLTSGNAVICYAGHASESDAITVSNAGTALTWVTVSGFPINHSGAGTARLYLFVAKVDASNVTSISFTHTNASISAGCVEFSPAATWGVSSALVDQIGTGETTTQTSHDVSAALTTTVADEAMLHAVGCTSTVTTWTANASWTLTGSPGTRAFGSQYRTVSATGTYQGPMTTNATRDCVIGMVTIKESSTPTDTLRTGSMLFTGIGR